MATDIRTVSDTMPPLDRTHPARADSLGWLALLATIVAFAAFAAAAVFSPTPNEGFKDQASALILIAAAAVAIERILEVIWIFVDNTRGSFWPLSAIDRHVTELVNRITDATGGPLGELARGAAAAHRESTLANERLAALRAELAAFQEELHQIRTLAPNSERAKLVVSTARAGVTQIEARYPELQASVAAANGLLGAASDVLRTDNPGRRVLSIYAGVVLGLIAAGFVGLDVFAATLGSKAVADSGLRWGVALTGVVIGLGSAPTHEVIKALQTLRKTRA